MIFGRRRGSGHGLQQKKLAPDAQQLGNAPAFFIALGSRQRLVDCVQSLSNLPGTAQNLCHQERKELRDGPGRTWFGETGAQQP